MLCTPHFLRNRQTQFQRKVGRRFSAAHGREQLLGPLQRGIFLPAGTATFQVPVDLMHFFPGYCAIQIRREQGCSLGTLHGVTSTSLPSVEPRGRIATFNLRSCGALNPSSGPTCRTYFTRRCFNASRPRVSRDFTVPRETCVISA